MTNLNQKPSNNHIKSAPYGRWDAATAVPLM